MPVKTLTNKLKSFFKNLYFLCFLNGVLLTSLFYFFTESKYETELFKIIAGKIKTQLTENYSKTDFALKAMHTSYELQEKRYLMFGNQQLEGVKANFFHPSTVDLMTGNGACGSYSTVLARILKSNDMPVKIGQMKVKGVYGVHMFIETKTENGWIVLDPMFDLAFKKPDGTIAGFNDLNTNWGYYKQQLPNDYNTAYSYEGVRYTNWDKIPGITTSIKSMLNIVLGKEKADLISIRPYLLRIYNKLAWITFFIWAFIFYSTVKKLRKKYKRPVLKIVGTVENEKRTNTG